ncbi:MAG: hypothetical protein LBB43_02340 [Spirochaetaceae bacterium]|jgi:hypothetical protein|nr:hypothetical protein [Spirochaetaceae bacterium]
MKRILLGVMVVLLLGSCLGIRSNIAIKANGSGTVMMEYRISQAIQSIGKLDGNANWPTVPVSKEDFERSIIRIPGLKLRSFKTKTTDNDIVMTIKLEFVDLDALVNFLDATGRHASIVQDGGKKQLTLVLSDEHSIDSDLINLAALLSTGYMFELHFSMPETGTLSVVDVNGKPIQGVNRTSLAIPMSQLLSYRDGVELKLVW